MAWNTRIFSATAGKKFLFNFLIVLFSFNYINHFVYLWIGLLLIVSGGGAFCNGQKIHASQTDRVSDHIFIKIFKFIHSTKLPNMCRLTQ